MVLILAKIANQSLRCKELSRMRVYGGAARFLGLSVSKEAGLAKTKSRAAQIEGLGLEASIEGHEALMGIRNFNVRDSIAEIPLKKTGCLSQRMSLNCIALYRSNNEHDWPTLRHLLKRCRETRGARWYYRPFLVDLHSKIN